MSPSAPGRVFVPTVERALGKPYLVRLATGLAGARARGVALLWHRIRPGGELPHEVVRSVATSAFEQQLDLLEDLGEIVPLSRLERPRRGSRPRFALTFDDDDRGHVEHTLPILRARQLPATFFLSGRWRDSLGPYWWEVLEEDIRLYGSGVAASKYDLPQDTNPAGIARAVTGTHHARELAQSAKGRKAVTMSVQDAHQLASAGMEIGFHTIEHPALPRLDDRELRRAVTDGRRELAEESGAALNRFAYPHGQVDVRAAEAVRAAGFVSGWTTTKRVTRGGDDHMRLGRWDLGRLGIDDFRVALLRGLARPGP